MTTLNFKISSELPVRPAVILPSLTMEGVNAELRPLIRMTAPADWVTRSILKWPPETHLFSSWILLFGVLPIDRHSFYFKLIEPELGFSEASSSIINELWCHQRTIVPTDRGCIVTDTVSFSCRAPMVGYLLKPVYEIVFSRRHRNLKTRHCAVYS